MSKVFMWTEISAEGISDFRGDYLASGYDYN
jgi:hypothetical protein